MKRAEPPAVTMEYLRDWFARHRDDYCSHDASPPHAWSEYFEWLLQDVARLTERVQALRTALLSMVEWHGGVHGEDCPEDDTCECIGQSINAAVNAALREDQP